MIAKNHILKICTLSTAFILLSIFAININASNSKTSENTSLPMLWDFGAKKCIACKKLAPILEKLKSEYKGELIVKFTDVWKSENAQLAKEHGIQSIPTQIFFDKNGKELWRHVGYISKKNIIAKWKSLGYDFTENKAKTTEDSNHDSDK
ncbi:MAG: thioredoxin family protein [Victivallales bacterium]|nr:thioredoxin family protein [Victivallales bacterium]